MGSTKQKLVLYSSAEIHSCIKKLFLKPHKNDRRVALVAYVGNDGESYLPHPEGLHLICSPSAGGTSPDTIRSLILRNAKVQFSSGLHMKVYWSRQRGCLITSANASSNALGRHGLKEAGIWVPSTSVDIDRLIRYAKPRIITGTELRKLDLLTKSRNKDLQQKMGTENRMNFLEWYSMPHKSSWKLGWGDEELSGTANNAKDATLSAYGIREPHSWQSTARGRIKPHDWLLCFTLTEKGLKTLEWKFVDFLVKISPRDKKFYNKDWPFHAVQVHPLSRYAVMPPFEVTSAFRSAFKHAVREITHTVLKNSKTDKPPAELLNLIAMKMKHPRPT